MTDVLKTFWIVENILEGPKEEKEKWQGWLSLNFCIKSKKIVTFGN